MEITSAALTVRELYNGLADGTISIDENGHDPFYGWGAEKRLIEPLKKKLEYYDSRNDTLLKKVFLSNRANEKIGTLSDRGDRHIEDLKSDFECSQCGNRLVWIYIPEESKIKCIKGELNSDSDKISDWFYEYDDKRCPEEFNHPQEFTMDIKDTLVFANFFRTHMKLDEANKDKEYSSEFSLNTLAGRKRWATYYASKNIGYQQLGNTSIEVFINKEKTELIVIEQSYIEDEKTGRSYEAEVSLKRFGYKKVGYVSCDMWRYMFMNKSEIGDNEDEIGGGSFEVDVIPGKYKVSNYFGTDEHESHKIFRFDVTARIKLIQ